MKIIAKYVFISLLIILNSINGVVIITEADGITPLDITRGNSNPNAKLDLELALQAAYYQKPAALMTTAESSVLFASLLERQNVRITHMPQTCWDLFALLAHVQTIFSITSVAASNCINSETFTGYFRGNAAFIRYINDSSQTELLQARNFTTIATNIFDQIVAHLENYYQQNPGAIKDSGVDGASPAYGCEEKYLSLMFANRCYPELKAVLIKATEIEADCIARDWLPVWRYSKTTKPEEEQAHEAMQKAQPSLGSFSVGFSVLADFVGDGTLMGLSDYAVGSACVFSYLAQELRDRVFASTSTVPYYIMGQSSLKPQNVKVALDERRFELDCIFVPKAAITGNNWFFPNVNPQSLVHLRGESSHPRFLIDPQPEEIHELRMRNTLPQTPNEALESFSQLERITIVRNGVVLSQQAGGGSQGD